MSQCPTRSTRCRIATPAWSRHFRPHRARRPKLRPPRPRCSSSRVSENEVSFRRHTSHNRRYAIVEEWPAKLCAPYEMRHKLICSRLGNRNCMGTASAAPYGWGLASCNARSRCTRNRGCRRDFRDVVAYSSSVEQAWVIKKETLTSPSRSPIPKGEFRLSQYQQLGGHFFQRATSVTASRSVGAGRDESRHLSRAA